MRTNIVTKTDDLEIPTFLRRDASEAKKDSPKVETKKAPGPFDAKAALAALAKEKAAKTKAGAPALNATRAKEAEAAKKAETPKRTTEGRNVNPIFGKLLRGSNRERLCLFLAANVGKYVSTDDAVKATYPDGDGSKGSLGMVIKGAVHFLDKTYPRYRALREGQEGSYEIRRESGKIGVFSTAPVEAAPKKRSAKK